MQATKLRHFFRFVLCCRCRLFWLCISMLGIIYKIQHIYTPVSYLLYSYDFLEQGDALNNLSSHVMLFFRRETDGRFTVYESSALDWKVSLRSYYAYQISGYSPYRYWQYSASNKFSVGTRVQVATTENLPVRNSYTRSATQLYSVTYPATGTIVEGPMKMKDFYG